MAATPLANTDDVAAVWRPLNDAEQQRVVTLIDKASARLRQRCPFDIDARIALFSSDPTQPTALDPAVVADVVATIVKRFLVNADGVASTTQTVGPFAQSQNFVGQHDSTGADTRGTLVVTDSDIDQLRPAVPAAKPSSFRLGLPAPQVLLPNAVGPDGCPGPAVVDDITIGRGSE